LIPVPGSQFAFLESDITVFKTVDETILSSTILHDDLHLFFTLKTSIIYAFDLQLILNSVVAGSDWKFAFSMPSSTTMFWGSHGGASNYFDPAGPGGSSVALLTESSVLTIGNAANRIIGAALRGVVYTGSTPGLLRVRWAQNTSQASNSTVKRGSTMRLRAL
jgi:hypothetical protein